MMLISNRFGYSDTVSQLLTVPVYTAAGEYFSRYSSMQKTDILKGIAMLILGHFSDKMQLRSPFIMGSQAVALAGYAIVMSNAPSGVKYFGTFLCTVGLFSIFPAAICW